MTGAATEDDRLPDAVAAQLAPAGGSVRVVGESPQPAGTGAATGAVTLLDVEFSSSDRVETTTIVRKRLRPTTSGRHADGTRQPRHWAYWRREAEAYTSGLLPVGPRLRAPRCLGVVGDDVYLELVSGPAPGVDHAAVALASWQRPWDPVLDRPWLARDQLVQRLDVSQLDWTEVDADPRMADLWGRRSELVSRLAGLPRVLSHGDYSVGNLILDGRGVVAIDWATVGWEPLGFDLGHLALSTGADPTHAYLGAAPKTAERDAVLTGFAITVALVGSSRTHWMLTRGIEPQPWYADFVWDCASRLR